MPQTIAFGKLPGFGGNGAFVAMGTAAGMSEAGTFFVTDPASGSPIMRNTGPVFVSKMGSDYAIVGAKGSSSGLITLAFARGTGPDSQGYAGGTLDINWIAFGGHGSI